MDLMSSIKSLLSTEVKTHHYIIFFVRPLHSKGIVFIRQNMTSVYGPRTERIKIFVMAFSTAKNVELLGLYPKCNVLNITQMVTATL